ncbi:uncharacterized protein LOC111391085 [Olea europaea subsp. europaea]|uniref:Uncharacterized protein LOC111391085 n=1 Tax=Olea europaea subsp. europaea TaxID=158383 RepID=A0A8S0PQQ3_OLEEU|nr:uncharacterized protein LOC111391085 [Olea europaea subsp. europaea]
MDSVQCRALCDRWSECSDVCDYDSEEMKYMQNKLDSPMPWIGMCITAASVVCSLAIAADTFHGFRSKRLWFPCKYFSFNAMSLTILAVTLKLPVDFTANMLGINESIARVSSLVFMSIVMANFMTSLGSMDANEMLLNLAALGILIITVIGNVYLHLVTMRIYTDFLEIFSEEIVVTSFIFISLVMFCSSALTVITTRSYIQCKYQEMHKIALDEEKVDGPKFPVDKLRLVVKKYWVMAVTGCPQFVMARSVICTASGLMCVLAALTLIEAYIRTPIQYDGYQENFSSYKWSIKWILYVQSIGVALGIIAPAFRWFTAARFKCSDIGRKSFKTDLKIETYWIQRLVDLRESPLPLQVRHRKWKKFLHDVKRLLLNCCLGLQYLLVWASKLVLLISASFFHGIKKLKIFVIGASDDTGGSESGGDAQLDLTRYVLLLQGEPGIPKKTLKNIGDEVDKVMEKGKKQKPINLIELLHKSNNFNGVREFDNNQVPSLHSQEPPNIWSLPLVTLTCIAIALPNVSDDNANQLVRCVGEGLTLLKHIDKSLDKNGDLAIIKNAADVEWVGVDFNCKWQNKDLRKISRQSKTSKEPLEELSNDAERTVKKFLSEVNDFLMVKPLNWPARIIAANSMYRISRTILLAIGNNETDDGLFDHLSLMIADILAASLTNLPHVIITKCHHHSLKERQKSVRQAALLLGETEEILQILQQREIPSFDPDRAAYIDEWHTFIKEDNGNSLASISSIGSETKQSNEEHVAIELHDGVKNRS